MLNKTKTLEVLIQNKKPIIKAISYMDSINSNYIEKVQFESFVKETLDITKSISNKKQLIENIKSAYNIKNLISHRLINFDEGSDKLNFIKYLEDMFRDISEDIKPKPITKRSFIDHIHNLEHLIKDSYYYESYSKSEKELFLEDLKNKLNVIQQDFDKNRNIITKEADNLSKFLEDDVNDNNAKREMMLKIIELSDKYIEPFFNFLRERNNEDGFINKMKKIILFFEDIEDTKEALEVQRFLINFKSYHKDIQSVYEKINDYRRKRNEDLNIYNAFERAFNDLNTISNNLQDGKLLNNYLESSDFHKKFNHLDFIKAQKFNKSDIQVDYEDFTNRVRKIEDFILLENEEIKSEDKVENLNKEQLEEIKKADDLFLEKSNINKENTKLISKILLINQKSLMKKDKEIDLIYKVHKILSSNMENYKIFFTIYAYNSIRKKINKVEVGYNKRKYIEFNNKTYSYRPVYNLGEDTHE